MSDPLTVVAGLPGVPAATGAAREAVDRLLAARMLRRRAPLVVGEAALRAAQASAVLEGAAVSLSEVRTSAQEGKPLPGEAGALVRGALRVAAESAVLLPVWQRAPLQALARLHVLAAAARLPPAELGRPRAGARPVDPLGLGPAPDPDEVAARLDALAAVLVAPTAAPALVVAAVVHGELLTLRPFVWGNGLVARAASRLVLVSRGLDGKGVTVPEVGHVELGRAAYRDAADGYAGGTPEGVAAWLVHCAQAALLGAREGLAVCAALERAS